MSTAFLVQLTITLLFTSLLVLVATWARIPRATPPLTETTVRNLLLDEYPELLPDRVWIGSDGASAVVASSDQAILISPVGDGHVARQIPWAHLGQAQRAGDVLALHLSDPAAPKLTLAWPASLAWPPQRA